MRYLALAAALSMLGVGVARWAQAKPIPQEPPACSFCRFRMADPP